MYDSILARSFSRHEQKKLRYGAFFCFLLVLLFFCTLFKPYFGPIPALNLRVSMGTLGFKMLALKATNSSQQMVKGMNQYSWGVFLGTKGVTNNASDRRLYKENSTSELHDWKVGQKGSPNASLQVENSTSEHHDWKISKKGSRNESLQVKNSTSELHDWEKSEKGPRNESLQVGNSISELHDWKINQKGSRNESLQVGNSTSQHYTETTTPSETPIKKVAKRKMQPLCNIEVARTEFCDIKMDVWIEGKSASVLVVPSQMDDQFIPEENNTWSIQPYARKEDKTAMSGVRKWTVKPGKGDQEIPKCAKNHNVPAVLFSLGGYIGNNFHEFTDVVVPLFITSRKFNGEVQFLVSDNRPYWIAKFKKLLQGLSNYEIIEIDKEEGVHCFPSAIVGLKRHPQELSIDPLKHSYSMRDFKAFLRSTYSLKRDKAIRIREGKHKKVKPRLLIISRKRTRAFTNMGEITKMARNLGYKVIVTEADSNLANFAELVNSCDVLMGVHGAGLTNIVFLPENAVFIQVLPFGGFEWLGNTYFGEPSKEMNLKYLDYKIGREESSLLQQYPLDHVVFTDPSSFARKGWLVYKAIYLDKQNVNLDINRFRPVLEKALELLHQ
ncbi:hypothetical protein UlMin_008690 [Ulmus minor]